MASAPTPPSSDATRSSNDAVVGLTMRVYVLPNRFRSNRSAACWVSSKTYDAVWKIGTARAPVVASTRWPAWIWRVSNP